MNSLPKIEELQQKMKEGEEADKAIFAEMKSNILLVAGLHYSKTHSSYQNALRRVSGQSADTVKDERLKLTKNHIQRVQKIKLNNLMSYCPDIMVSPANPSEYQDIKAAQMYDAVGKYIKRNHKIKTKMRGWAKRFLDLGETFVVVFWDVNKGPVVGTQVTEDENGEQVETVIRAGELVFEEHFAFNVIRDKNSDTIEESPWLCIRQMHSKKDLLSMVKHDEKLAGLIQQDTNDTYRVFDVTNGEYRDTKDMAMLQKWFFRPCEQYPTGYYAYATKQGYLFQGPLPEGVFPVKYAAYQELETNPRAISDIRHLRPYQVEINRSASKIAEHQITLGDDKLIVQNGSKIANGGKLAGIRAINVTGGAPVILPGRNGAQYFEYNVAQKEELYEAANLSMDMLEKQQQMDPYTILFSSMREKKQFSIYAEKFEEFLIDIWDTAFRLTKLYAKDEMVIRATGKGETFNMAEFRNQDDLSTQIEIDRRTGDMESKLGQQLTLNHIVQYAGQSLAPENLGLIIRNMPYVNKEEIFADLTIDYDNVMNDILALDRGTKITVNKGDNHEYHIKKLSHRMRKADFRTLHPYIAELYNDALNQHNYFIQMKLEEAKRMQSELIPDSGPLVACDFYVESPDGMPKKARIPLNSLQWLADTLAAQGSSADAIQASLMVKMQQAQAPQQVPPPMAETING